MKAAQTTAPMSQSATSVATELRVVDQQEDLHSRIQEIQSKQLRSQLDRQDELIKSIEKLASLDNVEEVERQRRIYEAELTTVRAEIAKRQEDVGVLAYELFGLYDQLGMQAMTAKEDTAEDKLRRNAAGARIDEDREALGRAKAKLETLDLSNPASAAAIKKATIETSWNFLTKKGELEAFDRQHSTDLDTVTAIIKEAEAAIKASEQNLQEVEAQIEIDKADRVRKSSFSESFALIGEFTKQALTLLREDIVETEQRRVTTKNGLSSALTAKSTVARELDAAKDELVRLERDLERELKQLNEIPDQKSAAYAEQQKAVVGIEEQLAVKRGEELKLNTRHMALTAAIKATSSSLVGLATQGDTAEVYVIRFETAEKTAHLLGKNIDRMVKNTLKETGSDALDRANDSMIMSAFDLGIQAEVASAKLRNEALLRHDKLMEKLVSARETGDKAAAAEAARYFALDAKIRKGYEDLGIDVGMSHLEAAAASFTAREPKASVSSDADAVTY